jgi:hypothetical protein
MLSSQVLVEFHGVPEGPKGDLRAGAGPTAQTNKPWYSRISIPDLLSLKKSSTNSEMVGSLA